jgi:hypothetical protein
MTLIFILRKGTSKKYFQVKREELPKKYSRYSELLTKVILK